MNNRSLSIALDRLLRKYDISKEEYKVFNINYREMTEAEAKSIECLLDIDEVLTDLRLGYNWYEVPINKFPFLGRNPLQLILDEGIIGVYKARIYATAWHYNLLINTGENNGRR